VFFFDGTPPEPPPPPSALDELLHKLEPFVPPLALIPVLVAVYFVFRTTWRELDEDAHRHRGALLAQGKMDHRPFVALVLVAVMLAMQEYYGGRAYFQRSIRPLMESFDREHDNVLQLLKYDELYGFAWWSFTRCLGYVIIPFPVWKLCFPRDSLLDFGLRTKGFFKHVWIYGLALLLVVPLTYIVSTRPDFGSYYPFYKGSSRSWFDFLTWEALYFAQFFALEMFFRGFILGALRRSFGSGAIFAMAVPYCMIHFGKPYPETIGAIIAGVFLGSLSMKTKSIYQGFLVHITIAALMDWLALGNRDALPKEFWAP